MISRHLININMVEKVSFNRYIGSINFDFLKPVRLGFFN
ncbi:unnamed protein product, partial [marine sediment metagenome]